MKKVRKLLRQGSRDVMRSKSLLLDFTMIFLSLKNKKLLLHCNLYDLNFQCDFIEPYLESKSEFREIDNNH